MDPVSCVTDVNGRGGSAETSSVDSWSQPQLTFSRMTHISLTSLRKDPKFKVVNQNQRTRIPSLDLQTAYCAPNCFSYFNVCQPQDVAAPVSADQSSGIRKLGDLCWWTVTVSSGVSAGGCCSVPEDWLLDNVSATVFRMSWVWLHLWFFPLVGAGLWFHLSRLTESPSQCSARPHHAVLLSTCWDDLGHLCLDVSFMSVPQNDLLVW